MAVLLLACFVLYVLSLLFLVFLELCHITFINPPPNFISPLSVQDYYFIFLKWHKEIQIFFIDIFKGNTGTWKKGFRLGFWLILIAYAIWKGFPPSSVSKESACNAEDMGSIPGSGRSPWRRKWQPTPVFLPGESHGQRNLAGYSPWGRKSRTRLSDFHYFTTMRFERCINFLVKSNFLGFY